MGVDLAPAARATPYAGVRIALLTRHGKERVIAPVLEPQLACEVVHVDGFDTDELGTFTRDRPRAGTQLEAARRKARIGMTLAGLPVGLASEGSFGPDPCTGMLPWNVEMLVLLDDRLGIEVVGFAAGPGRSAHIQTASWAALESFARREGFPEHRLVLRPGRHDHPGPRKGIPDWEALRRCFDLCRSEADNGEVFAEIDLRACENPTRMRQIGLAAADLSRRLASLCPSCAGPGYWIVARRPGLPCSECGLPTEIYRTEVWACPSCQRNDERTRTDLSCAQPQHCSFCNP